MFFFNSYHIDELMKKQRLDSAALADKANLRADFVEYILNGHAAKTADFNALVKLGAALNCSPFALVQNHCAF